MNDRTLRVRLGLLVLAALVLLGVLILVFGSAPRFLRRGVTYTNARTPANSDSFPGTVGMPSPGVPSCLRP